MSFEPLAQGVSTDKRDFTDVGQNGETTKGEYSMNFSKLLLFN